MKNNAKFRFDEDADFNMVIIRKKRGSYTRGLVIYFDDKRRLDRFELIVAQLEFVKDMLYDLMTQVEKLKRDKNNISIKITSEKKEDYYDIRDTFYEMGLCTNYNYSELDWFMSSLTVVKKGERYIIQAYNDIDENMIDMDYVPQSKGAIIGEGKTINRALASAIQRIKSCLEWLPIIEQESFNVYATGLYETVE